MPDTGLDLGAYFARVGYAGPAAPTLETLSALQALHVAAIPFENIDVMLDRGISIDLADIHDKLVARERGGYCFEHNGLFQAVLTVIGFQVEGLLARVLWRLSAEPATRPRTHKMLRVTIDGEPWMVDVGFGACVPTAPLRMTPGLVQQTPHEDFRLIQETDGEMTLECDEEGWSPVYRLSPHSAADIDYVLSNWFTSTHPSSVFRAGLIAGRTTPEARYSLLQNRLTVRPMGGAMRREELDLDGLIACLSRDFGITPQDDWRPMLERMAAAGTDR